MARHLLSWNVSKSQLLSLGMVLFVFFALMGTLHAEEGVAPIEPQSITESETASPLAAKKVQPPVPNSATEVTSAKHLLKTIFGLLVVIVVILALAWMVKRYGNFSVSGQGQLKLVAGLNVGQKERVVIVQVGETQLLLGVSPGRVEKLHEISTEDQVHITELTSTENNDFATRLKQAIKGRAS